MKLLAFVGQSAGLGLAIAFVVLVWKPELLRPGLTPPPSGPDSYAAAVEASAPAVVNIYTAGIPGQRSGFGERYYSVDFGRTDHAAVAAAFGVKSWKVEDPAELRSVLAAAVATDGPALVDVIVQPLHKAAAPVSEWVA